MQAAELAIVAGADVLASYESSPGKARHFCSRCGSPIFSRSQATSELVSVRAGTLDGDPGVRPSVNIFVASRAPWYEIRDGLLQKDEGLV